MAVVIDKAFGSTENEVACDEIVNDRIFQDQRIAASECELNIVARLTGDRNDFCKGIKAWPKTADFDLVCIR